MVVLRWKGKSLRALEQYQAAVPGRVAFTPFGHFKVHVYKQGLCSNSPACRASVILLFV